ncbi:Hypothetical predicted protein [Mytilus galloprovincialis]|uniref:IgGFc-binding protein N-terminal domain-containing protein n=1 Tax=Mytilus galloprovincialis TaxID=29158 RepID=A0A8B6BML9_MYTGA|nr:Hypothetical predicted protein [Mytilus galloprovincialis]
MNIFFVLLFLSLFHEKVEGDAVQIETVDSKQGDPLSIPLISDGGAPLVAMLDTSSMNVRIKSFIKTLMGKMIEESLTADSTTDIIRNITKLELNQELVNIVMTHVTFREQIQNIVKETLKQNSTIDLIRNIAVQELDGQLRQRNQSEDKVISDSDQDIEFDIISKPISVTDTTGNEFYLGFLESYNQNGKLYLYIVSTTDGSCKIFIPSLSINTSFAISNTSINSYDISPSVFMNQNGIQRKAINVKCDIPVSIYGLTFTGSEVDGFLALPSKSLGNKYIVSSFTPWKLDKPYSNSNFGIIGIDQSTNVTIHFRITGGNVTYNNIKYGNNDTLRIHLTQFDTFLFLMIMILVVTLVCASSPVAVMSGVRTKFP